MGNVAEMIMRELEKNGLGGKVVDYDYDLAAVFPIISGIELLYPELFMNI